jgi:hypothetical protein
LGSPAALRQSIAHADDELPRQQQTSIMVTTLFMTVRSMLMKNLDKKVSNVHDRKNSELETALHDNLQQQRNYSLSA